jgi:hypothetical protein
VMDEATRLANLSPGGWRLWIDRSAERIGVSRAALQKLVETIVKDNEKKVRGPRPKFAGAKPDQIALRIS